LDRSNDFPSGSTSYASSLSNIVASNIFLDRSQRLGAARLRSAD
jgi:hypothetical protein